MSDLRFSVLIATYEGDDPEGLSQSLRSVLDQTVQPDEIVIVEDGPLTPELEGVLDELETAHPGLIVRTALPTNQGLGAALKHGVETCSHEWIARMDADDIAVPNRFEQQLDYLESHPDTDVLGGYIGEFADDPANINTVREVPLEEEKLKPAARFQNPLNHPTVIFRREAVLEVGNYDSRRLIQDYELWMRMLAEGYTIANIPEVLVKCEAGEDLFRRRGGVEYAKTETRLQYKFLQLGVISVPVFVFNLLTRIPVRLAPNRIRGIIYRSILRNDGNSH